MDERFDDCEHLLKQIDDMPIEEPHFSSWNKLWSYHTKFRLKRAQRLWTEAHELAELAIRSADRRSDHLMSTWARVLRADSLTSLSDRPGAIATLIEAENLYDGASPHVRAELERVHGRLDTQNGDFNSARAHFERALRILNVLESVYIRRDVLDDYLQTLQAADPDERPRELEVLEKARSSFVDASEDPTLGSPQRISESPLGAWELALIFELARYPELFAREVFYLAAKSSRGEHLGLVVSERDESIEIVSAIGWNRSEALQAASQAGSVEHISLGKSQDRSFALIGSFGGNLHSVKTVLALRRLITAALALEGYRQQDRQEAAFWPLQLETTATEDGIYLSEETTATLATARKIAPSDVTVLITGDTGTGKELLARSIHRHSGRAKKPFIPFNCRAVPRDMLDSQLFGHRRGAFTGAQEHFSGVIRAAAGGTLLLDEIGEIDPDVQPKLLRFLESGEIHPLGEPHPIRVDVRIIAATNAKLDSLVAEGRFREDLYYRLNVIRLHLPPLRERREEIVPLTQHFLRAYGQSSGKLGIRCSEEVIECLLLYAWPGNVRQLSNEIRRLVALTEANSLLTPDDLSVEIRSSRRASAATDELPTDSVPGIFVRLDQPLGVAVANVERALIAHALTQSSGLVSQAAEKLGVSRKGLFLKRRRLGFSISTAA